MIKKFLLSISCLGMICLQAISQMAPGSWQDYLPYQEGKKVVLAQSKVYCASQTSMFYYDTDDGSINKFSRVQGLNDVGIAAIGYSSEEQTMVVVYSNANIDVIKNGLISNISDVKSKSNLVDKTANNIEIIGENAFISFGFGIVVLNLKKLEIRDSYILGEDLETFKINDIAVDDTYLYAATNKGIYRADKNNSFLIDFSNWTRINDLVEPESNYTSIEFHNNRIYTILKKEDYVDDRIFSLQEGIWSELVLSFGIKKYSNIKSSEANLYILAENAVGKLNDNNIIERTIIQSRPTDLVSLANTLYVSGIDSGLMMIKPDNSMLKIIPEGPAGSEAVHISLWEDNIYISTGGMTEAWNPGYSSKGVFARMNGKWQVISPFTQPGLTGSFDFQRTAVNPKKPEELIMSNFVGMGLYKLINGKFSTLYNESNSTISQLVIEDYRVYKTFATTYDATGNLWVSNIYVDNSISVLKPDGQWKAFKFEKAISLKNIGDIIATSNGQKWVVIPKGNGVFVFDEKGTIDDERDDQYKSLAIKVEEQETGVSVNDVYSIAEDLDGNIWVGTANGPVVYYNPSKVFQTNELTGSRIKIPRNDGTNLADILLQQEKINSIVIDGANRKWFATQNSGVFLMSEDGKTQIHNFTFENSPLLSNTVKHIALQPKTGEVFFSTDKGVISYRDYATKGNGAFDDVYVYPNPVRPGFEGNIVIAGLIENTIVKITDISGNLVYETTSLGGQAIWNGKTFADRKVNSGVYLVFCSTEDGSQSHVTKLLLVR